MLTKRSLDQCIKISLRIFLIPSIICTLFTVVFLVKESLPFFKDVSISDFLLGYNWQPLIEPRSFGVLPLVSGTMHIVLISIIFALPVGILSSIYLSEIASKKIRKYLKPSLELLAGVPSVVFGYFALITLTPIIRIFFPQIEAFNSLSAALVVGVMILPMITSLCDDSLQSLPKSIKEAAYALGCTQFECIFFVQLPAVFKQMSASVLLAISRAIGETMAVTLAAGATPSLHFDPLKSIQTMTAFIVQVCLGDAQNGTVEYHSCFAVALLLFLITFFFNGLGKLILKRAKNHDY